MSTSFPFLAIARAHRVPYGAVLRITEAMPLLMRGWGSKLNEQTGADYDRYYHPILINDICKAIIAERLRRDLVNAEDVV